MKNLGEESPIHLAVRACTENSTEILELVLNNGGAMMVNEEDEHGWTSLHMAALYPTNNENVIKLLLDNGAEKDYLDKNDFTPEALAENEGYFATADLIR